MSLEDCNSIIFYDTETLTRFYKCLDKLIIKAQIRGLWKISNWKLIPNSNKLQKQSLTEGYYNRQMKAHLLKLEKKMRIKQEITKNRAYLKIIAYSKALKHSSPFKSKLSTPIKSPMFTPERFSSVKTKPATSPLFYPLHKLMIFINQNHYMSTVKFFKLWKVQVLLYKRKFIL